MKENNNFAMLSLHSEQTQIWAETLLQEVKYNNLKFKIPTFKADLIALTNLIKRFNSTIKAKLDNVDLHRNNAENISKVCELLANSDIENGTKFLGAIDFLAKNANVVFDENANIDKDITEKLSLISEINDKLIKFDIKELKKIAKKIINTPIK